MHTDEIDFLRRRIEAERLMAERSACDMAAGVHLRLMRMYEARLDREASDMVEIARPMDERMTQAMRSME